MAISRTTQAHLGKGDFDAVENEWLAQQEADPADLDYFVGVARALVGIGEDKRARVLLDMLDEQLRDGRWAVRLKLLRRAGELLLPPEKLHSAIVSTLGKLYSDRSTFKGLSEAVGLNRATQDLPKTWEKVDRLEGLLAFDVGSVVAMEGKGVGRVVEANLGLESFKVDFERHRGLMVGFKAAAKLLRALKPEHVLRRKLETPEKLRAESPSQLLRTTLLSYDRPLTAGDVREILSGIVSESQWTSWWSAARKHPQVLASGTGARQTYTWADSSGDAQDAVWKAFERAEPRKKMDLLRREGARDRGLRDRMAAVLTTVAEQVAGSDPGLAFEIWFALERSGGIPEDLMELDWGPETLLMNRDLGKLFSGIEERLLRERAYTMVRERREDWTALYREALARETDPRALEALAAGLLEGAPRELDRFLDMLLAQPHRHPAAFIWLAERAAVDETKRTRNPLRLLQQILTSIGRDEFAPYRQRLLVLAESGSTVPRLLQHLTEEQAPQAEDAVRRAAELEPYQRDQLITALELRFQSLRRDVEIPLYAVQASITAKRQELQQILSVEIPANRKAIEEARAMGDLRENFEYKSARQRHEYLNARASALNGELSRVRPIATLGTDNSEVRIGTRIRMIAGPDGSGNPGSPGNSGSSGGSGGPGRHERTLTILGPWESKPEAGVISYESDMGKELLGKKVGTELELGGESWKIVAIEPFD
ncbi:MAG: GreA/GreB family elongation factor [Acidobacteriota bacterium]|nr:GreA/GreB family elongation factor [Acidobacteriota bacterium]